MDADFWHKKWASGQIGFHLSAVNPLLERHFSALALPAGERIFLPLCGKTRDIAWLLSQGYRLAGAELSATAVEELFAELGIAPQISPVGACQRYSGEGIDIFVGDIFNLNSETLGQVDAIYDRAALVALPEAMRQRYAAHLITLTAAAPMLVVRYEYDQSLAAGPPFSVSEEEIQKLYSSTYQLSTLETLDVEGGLKGKCPARESVCLAKQQS